MADAVLDSLMRYGTIENKVRSVGYRMTSTVSQWKLGTSEAKVVLQVWVMITQLGG